MNDNEFNVYFRNTGSALKVMGSLPSSYIYYLPAPESFMIGTRVRSADENWAWVKSSSYSRELLTDIAKKFEKRSDPFIWPVFPDANAEMEHDMDELGLLTRKTFGAMIFDAALDVYEKKEPVNLNLNIRRALTLHDIFLWCDICWRAFTDEQETQSMPEFIIFARNAALSDKLKLLLGFVEDEPAGVFMLCQCEGTVVSHFSVLPKWRRLGVGSFFMNEIMKRSRLAGSRYIILTATNSGEKLYVRFGFRKLADIPIRSFSEDI